MISPPARPKLRQLQQRLSCGVVMVMVRVLVVNGRCKSWLANGYLVVLRMMMECMMVS